MGRSADGSNHHSLLISFNLKIVICAKNMDGNEELASIMNCSVNAAENIPIDIARSVELRVF